MITHVLFTVKKLAFGAQQGLLSHVQLGRSWVAWAPKTSECAACAMVSQHSPLRRLLGLLLVLWILQVRSKTGWRFLECRASKLCFFAISFCEATDSTPIHKSKKYNQTIYIYMYMNHNYDLGHAPQASRGLCSAGVLCWTEPLRSRLFPPRSRAQSTVIHRTFGRFLDFLDLLDSAHLPTAQVVTSSP